MRKFVQGSEPDFLFPDAFDGRWEIDTDPSADVSDRADRVTGAYKTTLFCGGEVLVGTAMIEGEPRRVWRLGGYFRLEGQQGGVKLPTMQRLVGEETWSTFEPTEFTAWSRQETVPAFPRPGVVDTLHVRLRCTGPARCRVAVDLPSGRVRGCGPAADGVENAAIAWMGRPHEVVEGRALFPWEDAFTGEAGPEAAGDLMGTLNMQTGRRGAELMGDAAWRAWMLLG